MPSWCDDGEIKERITQRIKNAVRFEFWKIWKQRGYICMRSFDSFKFLDIFKEMNKHILIVKSKIYLRINYTTFNEEIFVLNVVDSKLLTILSQLSFL